VVTEFCILFGHDSWLSHGTIVIDRRWPLVSCVLCRIQSINTLIDSIFEQRAFDKCALKRNEANRVPKQPSTTFSLSLLSVDSVWSKQKGTVSCLLTIHLSRLARTMTASPALFSQSLPGRLVATVSATAYQMWGQCIQSSWRHYIAILGIGSRLEGYPCSFAQWFEYQTRNYSSSTYPPHSFRLLHGCSLDSAKSFSTPRLRRQPKKRQGTFTSFLFLIICSLTQWTKRLRGEVLHIRYSSSLARISGLVGLTARWSRKEILKVKTPGGFFLLVFYGIVEGTSAWFGIRDVSLILSIDGIEIMMRMWLFESAWQISAAWICSPFIGYRYVWLDPSIERATSCVMDLQGSEVGLATHLVVDDQESPLG